MYSYYGGPPVYVSNTKYIILLYKSNHHIFFYYIYLLYREERFSNNCRETREEIFQGKEKNADRKQPTDFWRDLLLCIYYSIIYYYEYIYYPLSKKITRISKSPPLRNNEKSTESTKANLSGRILSRSIVYYLMIPEFDYHTQNTHCFPSRSKSGRNIVDVTRLVC